MQKKIDKTTNNNETPVTAFGVGDARGLGGVKRKEQGKEQ